MKIIYTLRGNNYKDDIAYEFDNETITAKYKNNVKLKAELEKELDRLKKIEKVTQNIKDQIRKIEDKLANLDITVLEDTFDLSVIEEGDEFQGIDTDLPIDPIVDAYRENGELYVKLAWMPLKVDERIKRFGDKSYRVNVMEYEVV